MGVTFSIPDFEVDYESECYSRERGCFLDIAQFSHVLVLSRLSSLLRV